MFQPFFNTMATNGKNELVQNPTKLQLKGNDLKWFIDNQLKTETKLEKVGDLDVVQGRLARLTPQIQYLISIYDIPVKLFLSSQFSTHY